MDLRIASSKCSSIKRQFQQPFASVPRDFSFRKDECIYFLYPSPLSVNSLCSVDPRKETLKIETVTDPDRGERELSRAEQLLRERMRASGSGITFYKYIKSCDSLLFDSGSGCSLVPCEPSQSQKSLCFPSKNGAVDYKLCPQDSEMLGCISDGDIWLLSPKASSPIRLTDTCEQRPSRKITAGQSSFILQEEFDRYSGYWWKPGQGTVEEGGAYGILYEEVDESMVEIVQTFNPGTQELDSYSYPRPGSVNAVSTLKYLTFRMVNGQVTDKKTQGLPKGIEDYLNSWEYYVRIGWTDTADNIWIHLMNRKQSRSQILFISASAFGAPDNCFPTPVVIWEETSESWINYSNVECLLFLPATSNDQNRLLITSEATGFPHIVLLEGNIQTPPDCSGPLQPIKAELKARPVTMGQWSVLSSDVWVDSAATMVYFRGNKSSCLDSHLYAVDLRGELPCSDPVQLTKSGFYHSLTVDPDAKLFISTCSSQETPPAVQLYKIDDAMLQSVYKADIRRTVSPPKTFTAPINFTTKANTGETLYGLVYPPVGLELGKKYPTIVFVYGGPHIQLVTNGFSSVIMRIAEWTHSGFAVVIVDNRGSANRGTAFESHIKNKMGAVEVDDQVAGLKAAAEAVSFIDLNRVGIYGWSYGGYMSLMAIAKKPEHFKVAVAGAPVTDWMWYDTGYTERYLGVPPQNLSAYEESSVLPLVEYFPNETGRLLIIHGMSDENVFFTHTSLLVDSLVRHGKPYQLQVYNGERHGLRSPSSTYHCDATVLLFLMNNL